ncbi:MAG TPA: sigma 54-interacting transcriptional regulator, partial [Bryobacteraceae bacterium]
MSWSIIIARCDGCLPAMWHHIARACNARVIPAASDEEAIVCVEKYSPECAVALFTLQLHPGVLSAAERIRRIDRTCPVLIVTSASTAEIILRALRAGVSDILDWDSPAERVADSLQRIAGEGLWGDSRADESSFLSATIPFLGRCPAVSGIREQIARVARSDANILITGESGTGKELVAELIHRNSPRRGGPFVAVNCAAIPDTLLESELFGHERGAFTGATSTRDGKLHAASAGTLFLDEVGDMSLTAQAKILRA